MAPVSNLQHVRQAALRALSGYRQVVAPIAFRLARARLARADRAYGDKVRPLPLLPFPAGSDGDQHFFLRRYREYGPVFRTWFHRRTTTHIVDFAAGRKLLTEHDDDIVAATVDLTPLFPHGSLRAMNADTHQNYRRLFVDAFKAVPLSTQQSVIVASFERLGETLARVDGPISASKLYATLNITSLEIMLGLTLGVTAADPQFAPLVQLLLILTPDGMFRYVKKRERDLYAQIRRLVGEVIAERQSAPPTSSLLAYFISIGRVDETSVGNLTQILATGVTDLLALLVWLIKMLGDDQAVQREIREAEPATAGELARASVYEALRLEQSEYIHRRAVRDFVFDRVLFEKDSRIKIAVWELHKDPEHFPEPFKFDPHRFMSGPLPGENYVPLGFGRHRCLGADWVIGLGGLMISTLVQKYGWEVVADGPSIRGVSHFQPSRAMQISFHRL